MPFNEQTHCPTEIREAIGLDLPYVNVPRIGDRSSESSNAGCDQTHCIVHMDPMSTKSARIVKRMITGEAWEAAPGSVDKAKAIGQLATNCGIGPPLATAEILEGQKVPTPSVTYYNCIGGFIVEGKDVIPKFISFVYWNMDPGHRIKWPDLTGRQQCEWIMSWEGSGRDYKRTVNHTIGLAGTDLGRIATTNTLQTALVNSPSLVNRRPAAHPLTANQWATESAEATRRRLFPDSPTGPEELQPQQQQQPQP